MRLCDKIRLARRESGFSQEKLAKALNCSRGLIAQYESGETKPPLKKLQALAELVNKPLAWLLDEQPAVIPATQADILALGDKFSEIGERLSAIMRECAEQLREIRKELNGRDKRNRTETHIYPHPL